MNTRLHFPAGLLDDLMGHLLRPLSIREEAAFLFARPAAEAGSFDVVEAVKLEGRDFVHRLSDYLELADETRARLIKRAHDLDASLVEMHSHLGPFPAAFSHADMIGLEDTVPYIWWRLKGRPYFAIVVASGGFDALAWLKGPDQPQALQSIVADGRLLHPTNNSLRI